MAYSELAWGKRSAGVDERGMQARVAQEPGRSRFLHPQQAVRAPRYKWSRPRGLLQPGERTGAAGGTAKRRQRSEAGWKARGRSSLIVLRKSGNPPQGTRQR